VEPSRPLLEAFLRSASVPLDPAAFQRTWEEAGRRIADGRLHLRRDHYDSLDARARASGYPALHHSEAYLRMADPAYRVVAREEAAALIRELGAQPP